MTVSATFVAFSFLILELLDYVMKIIGRGVILMSPVFHFWCLLGIFMFLCQIVTVTGRKFILVSCAYWNFCHCHNAQHHTVFRKLPLYVFR